jgi:hypothetical protein
LQVHFRGAQEFDMIGFWTNWLHTVQFSYETQSVIAQRLILLATGGANAAIEADRMIAEKFAAFGNAQIAAEKALSDGHDIFMAAEHAFGSVRDCVHANNLRLARGLH